MFVKFFPVLVTCLLVACAVGPDYRKPETLAPTQWLVNDSAGLKQVTPESLKNWWQSFDDVTLNRLMQQALKDNLDIKIALARIGQARAQRSNSQAELFPAVSATAGGQRQSNPFPGFRPGIRYNLFETSFDAVWETDLFGRLKRQLEAATAESEATDALYEQALVVLTAELARVYVEYRNGQNLLAITQTNLEAMRGTLTLTEQLFRQGVGTGNDVARARAQVEITEAQVPALEANKIAALRQLEALVGQRPGALATVVEPPAAIPSAPGRAMLASPANTLRHRPDIKVAERRLAAATALQGAAVAGLFPDISLSAFLGFRNINLDSLFKSSAFSYGTVGQLTQPLLNFGRVQAGIDLADARQQEAFLNYQKSIIEALQETETALTRYLQEEIRRQKLARSVADQEESVRLSQLRFQQGAASFLDVLDAQRALYAAQSDLSNSQAAAAINLIALYKSLGGGVDAAPLPAVNGKTRIAG